MTGHACVGGMTSYNASYNESYNESYYERIIRRSSHKPKQKPWLSTLMLPRKLFLILLLVVQRQVQVRRRKGAEFVQRHAVAQ